MNSTMIVNSTDRFEGFATGLKIVREKNIAKAREYIYWTMDIPHKHTVVLRYVTVCESSATIEF